MKKLILFNSFITPCKKTIWKTGQKYLKQLFLTWLFTFIFLFRIVCSKSNWNQNKYIKQTLNKPLIRHKNITGYKSVKPVQKVLTFDWYMILQARPDVWLMIPKEYIKMRQKIRKENNYYWSTIYRNLKVDFTYLTVR